MIRLPPRITTSPAHVEAGSLVAERQPSDQDAEDREDADVGT
jgi:hypothetical protein